MLEVSIRKKLPHFTVNVQFSCGSGQLLALLGPSGAGKTTIMRVLAGLEKPDAGRIVYNGEVWLDSEKNICLPPRQRKLGYVFQEFSLFPHLCVEKNVAFAADNQARVRELLHRFGIWHLRNHKPQGISGGERQRVALAQALAANPRVLLLDEPFSALDVQTKESLRGEVLAIKKQFSLPIIQVTHDLHEASLLADVVLPIVRGQVAGEWLAGILQGEKTIPKEFPKGQEAGRYAMEQAVRRIMTRPLAWSPGI